MSLAERLSRLEPRERRLLGLLGGVFGLLAFLAAPIAIAASVHRQANENEALRDSISSIEEARERVEKAQATRDAIKARYAQAAPPLAAFLAKVAADAQVEIPESQDRQAVPHGKRYSERSTKIVLRRVGMLKLIHLLESVEKSGYPMVLSSLNIRKRAIAPDSFDVDLVVSAFDRKAPEPKKNEPQSADGVQAGDKEASP